MWLLLPIGELTNEMKEYVQHLRAIIVSTRGDQFAFEDGEELASVDDVVHDSMWVVVTRAMWELVTLHPTRFLDGRAVWLLAKFSRVGRILESSSTTSATWSHVIPGGPSPKRAPCCCTTATDTSRP